MLIVEVDDSVAVRRLELLAAKIGDGLPETMKEANQILTDSTSRNFLAQGRPGLWAALRPATIRQRRALQRATQGRIPVAGLYTRLRLTDRMRKAAENVDGAEQGAILKVSPRGLVRGLDSAAFPQALRLQEGDPGANLVARPFLLIQPADADQIAGYGRQELGDIARAVEAAAL